MAALFHRAAIISIENCRMYYSQHAFNGGDYKNKKFQLTITRGQRRVAQQAQHHTGGQMHVIKIDRN